MRRYERFSGTGALIFGGLLILVGGYYVLRNNLGLDLGELDGDLIWPGLLVVIGAVMIGRGLRRTDQGA
jgi:hypothetical protein